MRRFFEGIRASAEPGRSWDVGVIELPETDARAVGALAAGGPIGWRRAASAWTWYGPARHDPCAGEQRRVRCPVVPRTPDSSLYVGRSRVR